MVIVGVLFFSQLWDLSHTVTSSFAYLNGHLIDFYEYNKEKVGGNDYLATVYIIFAIWMLPLHLLGISSSGNLSPGIEISSIELIWAKLALLTAFGLSVLVFQKISKIVFMNQATKVHATTIAYASSPFAFFAIGIFNQYDIFGVLFTLLGLLALLRGKTAQFSLFIGIAFTFKFFVGVIALPLLLYFVPRWKARIKYGFVMSLIPLLSTLPYLSSEAFRNGALDILGKESSFGPVAVFVVVLYCGLLIWADRSDKRLENRNKALVLLPLASYALLFNSVSWHPQWLVVITPFLALAIGYIRNALVFVFAETTAFVAFIWFVVNVYKGNVDGEMVMRGPLSELFESPLFSMSALYPSSGAAISLFVVNAFLLVTPAWVYLSKSNESYGKLLAWDQLALTLRALMPAIAFIIPALIAVLVPIEVAKTFSPNAALARDVVFDPNVPPEVVIGELVGGTVINQQIVAAPGKISAVSLLVATYTDRENRGSIRISLSNGYGTIACSETRDSEALKDNEYVILPCANFSIKESQNLDLKVESFGSVSGESPTLWMSSTDIYSPGKLTLNGKELPSDLVFRVYYAEKN